MRWRHVCCAAGFLLIQACGGKATETREGQAEAEEAPLPVELCDASCDHQQRYCATLDIPGCYELCRFVIAEIGQDQVCLEQASMVWGCDVLVDWQCSAETDIVGRPLDDASCILTRAEPRAEMRLA